MEHSRHSFFWAAAFSALMAAGCTAPGVAPATEALSPHALAHATYRTGLLAPQPVRLVDGRASLPGGGTVTLLGPSAAGTVAGQGAAAVLLAEQGGGTGVFVSVALVRETVGGPQNFATRLLGDRARVQRLSFESDGVLIVELVQVGPQDAFCCPTQPMRLRLQYRDGALDVVEYSSATLDARRLGLPLNASVEPATAYDRSPPPEGQGLPAHFVWTIDGAAASDSARASIAVYPVREWERLWGAAGDAEVSRRLEHLRALLAAPPGRLQAPLPVLPVRNASNDLAARPAYLALADGGTGVRFIGRFAQDATPLAPASLRYVVLALTRDEQHLVVADLPVRFAPLDATDGAALPAFDPARMDSYLQQWAQQLDAAPAAAFSPLLSELDALISSVNVRSSGTADASRR